MAIFKSASKNERKKYWCQTVTSSAHLAISLSEEVEFSIFRMLFKAWFLAPVIEKVVLSRISNRRKKLVEKIWKLVVRVRRNLLWGSIILGLVASSAPMVALVILGIAVLTGYDAWRIFQR